MSAGIPGQGHTEERVEYRDENGKLLNDEEVKALEGKVSFSTRYETRTRILDDNGNEIDEVVESGVAGTIADGENPETPGLPEGQASGKPPKVNVAEDLKKEQKVVNSKQTAEPSSDLGSATARDEL